MVLDLYMCLQEYIRPAGFACPWVPLLPVLSIALNMFLFAQVLLNPNLFHHSFQSQKHLVALTSTFNVYLVGSSLEPRCLYKDFRLCSFQMNLEIISPEDRPRL